MKHIDRILNLPIEYPIILSVAKDPSLAPLGPVTMPAPPKHQTVTLKLKQPR